VTTRKKTVNVDRLKIEIRNLSIGYRTKNGFTSLVENLSTSLFGGELTCLLGANGVGKSTLLRTLSGFQPKLAGEIYIFGKTIDDFSDKELSRTVGVVLTERPNAGDLTVAELIGLGRSPYTGFWGRLNKIDETVVKDVISWMKIEELADRSVMTLSDGEWQKTMIAKTLAQETPVIYLDEPTAFLDFPSKVEIMHLLLDLTRRKNKTVFLSTHDLELALQIADTLWLMDKKNGITVGTPDELRLNGSIENFFRCEGAVFDRESGFFRIKLNKKNTDETDWAD
jgi:iron complex transport system ATP-binding protein